MSTNKIIFKFQKGGGLKGVVSQSANYIPVSAYVADAGSFTPIEEKKIKLPEFDRAAIEKQLGKAHSAQIHQLLDSYEGWYNALNSMDYYDMLANPELQQKYNQLKNGISVSSLNDAINQKEITNKAYDISKSTDKEGLQSYVLTDNNNLLLVNENGERVEASHGEYLAKYKDQGFKPISNNEYMSLYDVKYSQDINDLTNRFIANSENSIKALSKIKSNILTGSAEGASTVEMLKNLSGEALQQYNIEMQLLGTETRKQSTSSNVQSINSYIETLRANFPKNSWNSIKSDIMQKIMDTNPDAITYRFGIIPPKTDKESEKLEYGFQDDKGNFLKEDEFLAKLKEFGTNEEAKQQFLSSFKRSDSEIDSQLDKMVDQNIVTYLSTGKVTKTTGERTIKVDVENSQDRASGGGNYKTDGMGYYLSSYLGVGTDEKFLVKKGTSDSGFEITGNAINFNTGDTKYEFINKNNKYENFTSGSSYLFSIAGKDNTAVKADDLNIKNDQNAKSVVINWLWKGDQPYIGTVESREKIAKFSTLADQYNRKVVQADGMPTGVEKSKLIDELRVEKQNLDGAEEELRSELNIGENEFQWSRSVVITGTVADEDNAGQFGVNDSDVFNAIEDAGAEDLLAGYNPASEYMVTTIKRANTKGVIHTNSSLDNKDITTLNLMTLSYLTDNVLFDLKTRK